MTDADRMRQYRTRHGLSEAAQVLAKQSYDEGLGAVRTARALQAAGLDGRPLRSLSRYVISWRHAQGLPAKYESYQLTEARAKRAHLRKPQYTNKRISEQEMDRRIRTALAKEEQFAREFIQKNRRPVRCAWCDTAPRGQPCIACHAEGAA